ncbi:MAG: metallophosphoesterase family protein [Ruminococcus sp.]|nr:metallophosphoesterase family protein [Ruminococcus sp.]
MRILAVADIESEYFYDFYSPGKLDGIDLIIGCGDLSEEYLEFLVTMAGCPLVYVHGNHDSSFKRKPEGCVCIDNTVFKYNGIRILGIDGSHRYKNGKYMYTERQMRRKIFRLFPKIMRYRGFDILVTHAPARHVNDFDSISHRGFECFTKLLRRFRPKYFLHGHIHRNYGACIPQKSKFGDTTVINAFNYCIFDI